MAFDIHTNLHIFVYASVSSQIYAVGYSYFLEQLCYFLRLHHSKIYHSTYYE